MIAIKQFLLIHILALDNSLGVDMPLNNYNQTKPMNNYDYSEVFTDESNFGFK